MSDWSSFHGDAKSGRVFRCKVCDLLAELSEEDARHVRQALQDSRVSENALERAMRARGQDIGRTAIRGHREKNHA